MKKSNVVKFPLHNSLGYHTLGTDNKEQSEVSQCAQEFIDYVQSIGVRVLERGISREVNKMILQYITSEKYLRQMIQSVNLSLTVEDVGQIFPDLVNQQFSNQAEPDEKISGSQLYRKIYEKMMENQ